MSGSDGSAVAVENYVIPSDDLVKVSLSLRVEFINGNTICLIMIYYTVTIPFAAVNISATTFIAPWRNGSPYTPFRLGIVSPIERSAIVRAKTAKFFFFPPLSFFSPSPRALSSLGEGRGERNATTEESESGSRCWPLLTQECKSTRNSVAAGD